MNLRDSAYAYYDTPIYIAGPMTGMAGYNYDAFNKMESYLRSLGFTKILNPTTIADGKKGLSYTFYIRESIKLLLNAELVVFLNGWENSRGAKFEKHMADVLGLKTFDQTLEYLKHE